MARVLSGIQPSGDPHIGNYLGAVRQWVAAQDVDDALYCIVDLHALTLDIEPDELRSRTLDTAIFLLAAGLDPARCTLFVQSHVAEHAELSWLLECVATDGELRRMIQYKEKAKGEESVRASLLTYPVLMAADILLYDADKVPVGDDQRQHLELTRNLANRFNSRYGETFVVPEADIPPVGARVMDLQEPARKMSKSVSSPGGTLNIADAPAEIERKIKRAVTDNDNEVAYDPARKPGVSNLLELLSGATGTPPSELAPRFSSYGQLKAETAAALIGVLEPIQAEMAALRRDPATVAAALRVGADKARGLAGATLARARKAIGLLEA
jgi:tryptophanyl-tRNA synthetase